MNEVITVDGRAPRFLYAAHRSRWAGVAIACALATHALAQPAQRPLLVTNTGAKPNLMVTLDNSGSMTAPFNDAYPIKKSEAQVSKVSDALSRAARSARVNSLYYDPRITYKPRVDAMGAPLVPNDGISSISNQKNVNHQYRLFFRTYDDLYGGGGSHLVEYAFPRKNEQVPQDWTTDWGGKGSELVPEHLTHSASEDSSAPPFTYALCPDWDKAKPLDGCPSPQVVNVQRRLPTPIELPIDHQRIDCQDVLKGGRSCTPNEEMDNIVNWYRYYATRMRATQTALGQAFQNHKLKDGILRVGYQLINKALWPNPLVPGKDLGHPLVSRGVREWKRGSPDNEQFYSWLYRALPVGQTPLHNAFDNVAAYLKANGLDTKENPWASDPSGLPSATNPEMSCRRSYHVMFSDGGWTSGIESAGRHIGEKHDNLRGPRFPRGSATTVSDEDFAYDPAGLSSKPQAYVPYPSTATGGLADLAAQYHWHTDFRPALANDVSTRPGQPTHWQNMRTYTIGYMIKPSGGSDTSTTGLTFAQIDRYRADYLMQVLPLTAPLWPQLPTGELNLHSGATESQRIDDFIQAGYTGGGRGFSVESADDIRSAIDAILADILNASGNDAGTALSSGDDSTQALAGRLQYFVNYQTTNNSGDVIAKKINEKALPILLDQDANGQTLSPPSDTFWSANQQMLPHSNRRVFSLTGTRSGIEFKGRLDALPSDIQAALRAGARANRLPEDSGFVEYLRGKALVPDKNGEPYRLRDSRLGAIVNSAPLSLVNAQHMGYDDATSGVDGKGSYADFRDRLSAAKGVLVVPTNAGEVHALDANNGQELAAFLPRRSLSRLLDQADPNAGFRYVLDGPLSTQEVHVDGAWQQLVVGTGGRGERLVYGLRVPIHADHSRAPGADDFLWETGPDRIDTAAFAAGHVTTPARGGQTDSGRWVTVLSSGHHNGRIDGSGHGLLVLDAMTGAVIRTLPLPEPALYPAGRGLGGVALVRDTRKRIVAAYAGDAKGQLWRFDLRGDPANWKVSYNKPLFQAPDKRPIYAAPAWQAHPKGGMIVVAATGMVLDESDETDVQQREGIFGIWDPTALSDGQEAPGFETVNPGQLLEQTVIERQIGDVTALDFTRNRIDWRVHRGWKLMLGYIDNSTSRMRWPGERVIDRLVNVGSSVKATSVIINRSNKEENCQSEGPPQNRDYQFNALDGVAKPAFDINNDGVPDVAMLLLDNGGFSRNAALTHLVPPAHMTPAQLRQSRFATQDGESDYENTKCLAAQYAMLGVNGSPVFGRVSCSYGWSRQQYQLATPPGVSTTTTPSTSPVQ